MSSKKEKAIVPTSRIEITADESELDIDILSLHPKMQRFVHLYCTGQYSLMKLSQLLNLNPNTLSQWARRDDVRKVMAKMQASTHEVVATNIKALAVSATEKLRELINSPIDGVALQAVKDVLDRTGHRPEHRIKVDKTVTTIEEKMKNLIDRTILEAEYEIVDTVSRVYGEDVDD